MVKTVKKTYSNLLPGDVLVNIDLPHLPHRTVKRVDPARAKGYLVVTFEGGQSTSAPMYTTLVNVLVK